MTAREAPALDELYGVPPAEFVAKRKELAARLAAAGDTEAARHVREQRRPTQAAYLLNQLARQNPAALAALRDAGHDLKVAQQAALGEGSTDELTDAIARQRRVLSDLTRDVTALSRELGLESVSLGDLAAAFRAAVVEPAVGKALEEGRLATLPEGEIGFPTSLGAGPSRRRAPRSPRTARDHAGERKATTRKATAQKATAQKATTRKATERKAAQRRAAERRATARRAAAEARARTDARKAEAARRAAERAVAQATKLARRADASAKAAERLRAPPSAA
jgi:hypothetical protein